MWCPWRWETQEILGRKIQSAEGSWSGGDFFGGPLADGVLYAGMGMTMNFGWGWDNVAHYIEKVLIQKPHTAQNHR